MKKSILFTFSLLLLTSLFAAPQKGGPVYEPVAEGYPAWGGLTDANHILGRRLVPSDLRHKRTLIVWVDVNKYEDQFKAIGKTIATWNPRMYALGESTENMAVPRDSICLVILVGNDKSFPETGDISKFINKNSQELSAAVFYIYKNVTGSKLPEPGKLPFYCLFGPEPGDPIASGELNDAGAKKISAARRNKKLVLENWRPYYGTVEEPKAVKGFTKILASGRPLEPLVASCQKGISSKDPEKAKECQILYDALEQTRSDYLFTVLSLARSCPTRAVYDAQIVMRQFPKTKKVLKPQIDRAMAIPDMKNLIVMYNDIRKWSAEDFQCKNAGEAKQIEARLKKMKLTCDNLIQKSTVPVVQSAAAWISSEAENLAPQMEGKIKAK